MPDLYEGLPLVPLVGEKGEDVVHLLRAIYERRCVFLLIFSPTSLLVTYFRGYYCRDDFKTPLDTIVTLLLLISKYDFKDIHNDVVIQISKRYTMTLCDYDAADKKEAPFFGKKRWDRAFTLLVAAYRSEVDVLLPTLYAVCSDYTLEAILNHSSSIPLDCLHTLLKGREGLDYQLNRLVADLPGLLQEVVAAKDSNYQKSEPCLTKAQFDGTKCLISATFKTLQGHAVVASCLSSVCASCGSSVAKAIDKRRSEIWTKVPSFFAHKEWDVLQAKLKRMKD